MAWFIKKYSKFRTETKRSLVSEWNILGLLCRAYCCRLSSWSCLLSLSWRLLLLLLFLASCRASCRAIDFSALLGTLARRSSQSCFGRAPLQGKRLSLFGYRTCTSLLSLGSLLRILICWDWSLLSGIFWPGCLSTSLSGLDLDRFDGGSFTPENGFLSEHIAAPLTVLHDKESLRNYLVLLLLEPIWSEENGKLSQISCYRLLLTWERPSLASSDIRTYPRAIPREVRLAWIYLPMIVPYFLPKASHASPLKNTWRHFSQALALSSDNLSTN